MHLCATHLAEQDKPGARAAGFRPVFAAIRVKSKMNGFSLFSTAGEFTLTERNVVLSISSTTIALLRRYSGSTKLLGGSDDRK